MSDAASEITRLRAALAASEARAEAAESELAQTRAVVSTSEAMIRHLRLEIAKLRREQYGHSSERRARLIAPTVSFAQPGTPSNGSSDALRIERIGHGSYGALCAFVVDVPGREVLQRPGIQQDQRPVNDRAGVHQRTAQGVLDGLHAGVGLAQNGERLR